MKRTIPLLITAIGGFALIVAFFIPETEGWGEVAAIWFDILASIAFILGGGNLLKIHLKKISDRPAGWGYSVVTVIAFLITLTIGFLKIGSPPATRQEYFGESFAPLRLSAFPDSQVTRRPGQIPVKADGAPLPASVREQLSQENGQIAFRGWMAPTQKRDLSNFQDELEWQCAVETLFAEAQPPESLSGKVRYDADHGALGFAGIMQESERDALLAMESGPEWQQAVGRLFEQSRAKHIVVATSFPENLSIPESLADAVSVDAQDNTITVTGPLSTSQRDALARQFPIAHPVAGERRRELRGEIEKRGSSFTDAQEKTFEKTLDGTWTPQQLRTVLDGAGKAAEQDKTACEMFAEKTAGVRDIEPTKTVGEDTTLNEAQVALLTRFADDPDASPGQLIDDLKAAGTFTGGQVAALNSFIASIPTVGQRNKDLCFALLRAGPLTQDQRDLLFADDRAQHSWRVTVGELFAAAHVPKYEWSGEYREQGSPFWWMFEYAFKPLTATMFAMLAFYVASAAFRAFRAKNVEASLLLGTAFIILLGQTFAGVLLTSWLPESLSGLRINNLTVYIMSVFNTAGNRAIMIGIALGIASTSLKVLLGVDRSYLGSGDD